MKVRIYQILGLMAVLAVPFLFSPPGCRSDRDPGAADPAWVTPVTSQPTIQLRMRRGDMLSTKEWIDEAYDKFGAADQAPAPGRISVRAAGGIAGKER